MAVQATLDFGGTVTKLISLSNLPGVTAIDRSLKARIDLHAGTNPAVDDVWARRVSLVATTVTLALDGLVETGVATPLNWTGKVIYGVIIHVLPSATGPMLFAGAALQPYELFGGATDQISVDPGGWADHYSPSGFGTISGTVSDITVTGTGTEQFDIALLAGTP